MSVSSRKASGRCRPKSIVDSCATGQRRRYLARLTIKTWAHTGNGPSKHRMRLTDPSGKTVPQAVFGNAEPTGQLLSGSMFPGKSLDDFLIFEVPSGKLEYLHLELGGSASAGRAPSSSGCHVV